MKHVLMLLVVFLMVGCSAPAPGLPCSCSRGERGRNRSIIGVRLRRRIDRNDSSPFKPMMLKMSFIDIGPGELIVIATILLFWLVLALVTLFALRRQSLTGTTQAI